MLLYEDKYTVILDSLASGAPTPGGGTAAALAGAMAAALVEMVGNLTLNRKKYSSVEAKMQSMVAEAAGARVTLLKLADEDALSYQAVMAAHKLPKGMESEVAERNSAIERATRQAVEVPLATAREALRVLQLAQSMAEEGNKNALTDAGVAALLSYAAAEGALYNVRINLASLAARPEWAQTIESEADNVALAALSLQAGMRERLSTLR